MALDVAWDLGPLTLYAVALGLAFLTLIIVKWLTAPIGWLPVIGADAEAALQAALVQPLESLVGGLEGRIAAGASKLLDDLAVLLAIPLLLGYGTYEGLKALWHHAIPALLHATVRPIEKEAAHAAALARTAEKDATKALRLAEHAATIDTAKLWKAVETHVASAVHTGVAGAERYADRAVAKVQAAEDGLVATATSLAHTAETDAAQAFSEAQAIAEGLGAPVGADLTELEKYLKGLGIAGLGAGLGALAHVVTTALSETGLENSDCRQKVKGVCGTNTGNWESLLAGLAVAGVAFDLRQIVGAANELGDEVVKLVKQAA